jgi:ribosomal protein L33
MRMKRFFQVFILILTVAFIGGCGASNESSEGNSYRQTTIEKSVDYDSAGRVVREDLGNGRYIEYVYDENGNLLDEKLALKKYCKWCKKHTTHKEMKL